MREEKMIIYQVLPRLFGNNNENRLENGKMAVENLLTLHLLVCEQ